MTGFPPVFTRDYLAIRENHENSYTDFNYLFIIFLLSFQEKNLNFQFWGTKISLKYRTIVNR